MPAPEIDRAIDQRLHQLHDRCRAEATDRVSAYYRAGRGYYPPEDAGPERDEFAVCVATTDGGVYEAGDASTPFALQSISKVFTYGIALSEQGPERVLERVGVEPSGDAFNSLRFDERRSRPFNPMVNAGALATTELVLGDDPDEQLARVLARVWDYAGHDGLQVDPETFDGEMATSDRNRGTAYLMRSAGMLRADPDAVLRLYLQQCSVAVTCRDLAVMAATLANGGANPLTGAQALPRRRVRDVLTVMHSCGMYDYAGQWAFEVGVPAKSGVSGGIMAVIPGKLGIAVYSRGLDQYGNSVRGIWVCRAMSDRLGLHVFAADVEDAVFGPADPGDAIAPTSPRDPVGPGAA